MDFIVIHLLISDSYCNTKMMIIYIFLNKIAAKAAQTNINNQMN